MPYTVIDNFRFGLDARRSELTSLPGALEVLANGHINQGGEIEKRKAFVMEQLPSNTFGLQSDGTDLWVFGSETEPVGLPSGVQYQRLQAFKNVVGVQLPKTMIGVEGSTIHDGKLFVLAKYDDNVVHAFYDGVEVSDFTEGIVSRAEVGDVIAMANRFTALINDLDAGQLTAVQDTPPDDNVVIVTGPPGVEYEATEVHESDHGDINIVKTVNPVAPIVALVATAQFRITNGSVNAGVNKIDSVQIGPVGGPYVTLTGGAVDYTVDNTNTAALVAASINTNASVPDYTADYIDNVVSIFAVEDASPQPNGYEVRVTVSGNVCIARCVFSIVGTAFALTALNANGTNILSAAYLAGTDNDFPGTYTTITTFVAGVAADINANTGTHGYVAFPQGEFLFVSRKVNSSTDGEISVSPVFTGNGTEGGGPDEGDRQTLQVSVPDSVIVDVSSASYVAPTSTNPITLVSQAIRASVTGGSGIYATFAWQKEVAGGSTALGPLSPSAQETKFYANRGNTGVATLADRFVCKVTDSEGVVGVSNALNISFRFR